MPHHEEQFAAGLMNSIVVNGFGNPDNLQVTQSDIPGIAAGEVLIEVAAAGLNFPDRLMAQGQYQNLPELPFVLGMECAGTVVQVGESVKDLQIGDRVLAFWNHGAFAQYTAVPESYVYRVPAEMDFESASIFGLSYMTAHLGLSRRAGLRPGEFVAVTGASGSVGEAAAYLAAWLGARVIAISRDVEATRERLGSVVECVIDADPETLRSQLLDATQGQGADIVFDVVGGEVLTQAMRALSWEGRAVVVGFAGGGQNPIKPGHLLVKNVGVLGVQVTDYCTREPAYVRGLIEEMLAAFGTGDLPVQRVQLVDPETLVSQIQGATQSDRATRTVVRFANSARVVNEKTLLTSAGE